MTLTSISQILPQIFRYLLLGNLYRMRKSNRRFRTAVESFLAKAYSPTKAVQFHLSNAEYEELQAIQAETRSLLSGRPVECFWRRFQPRGALLIIVEIRFAKKIQFWLDGICYQLTEVYESDTAARNTSLTVVTMWTYKRDEATIRVLVARRTAFEVVLNFPNTSLMNVFSHKNAYSLFPLLTCEQNSAYRITSPAPNFPQNFTELLFDHTQHRLGIFHDECWSFGIELPSVLPSPSAWAAALSTSAVAADKIRWITDGHSSSVPFDVSGRVGVVTDLLVLDSWCACYGENLFYLEYKPIVTATSESICLSVPEAADGRRTLSKLSRRASEIDAEIYHRIVATDYRNEAHRTDSAAWKMVSSIFSSLDIDLERRFDGFCACLLKILLQDLIDSHSLVTIEMQYRQHSAASGRLVSPRFCSLTTSVSQSSVDNPDCNMVSTTRPCPQEPAWVNEELKHAYVDARKKTGPRADRLAFNAKYKHIACAICVEKGIPCVQKPYGSQCVNCPRHQQCPRLPIMERLRITEKLNITTPRKAADYNQYHARSKAQSKQAHTTDSSDKDEDEYGSLTNAYGLSQPSPRANKIGSEDPSLKAYRRLRDSRAIWRASN
ncbi:hypothetical protein GYMLUDRAFT_253090 [Collybiopsis luxurians FD-317 M1]|uniref:F-box domain-containing protein n=1 Tax=Collybiopsis luxurians FD-317 M1 TaxID=944289 RepID=A0A0D0AJD3_9AGAR|nr:hypothetical protein GYMLUDRAFT_253090 [Collybiopsis luxurians FD-317 M1]